MLAKRIIPCLDVKNGRVVKGINFLNLKDAGDPVEQAAMYSREGADEIVFLDITASLEHRKTMLDVVRRTAEKVFIPFTVGGGIKKLSDIEIILKRGADKISINTAAVKNPRLIKEASREFGNQCIVVAIDAKKKISDSVREKSFIKKTESVKTKRFAWEVYIYGGKQSTGIDVLEWGRKVEDLGAGEILLTSMDKDGTKSGYDLELTKTISENLKIPIIASGGAGCLKHLYEALNYGNADAVLAASIFHYGLYKIKQTKRYLKRKGLIMRI